MAAIKVRELLTKWGFEVDNKPIERMNKSLADTKAVITLVGAQAIAQIGAVFGLTNSVAQLGDEAAKTSARIGINVEALQEYSHVAALAGSSTQEMNSALEALTLGIAEARKGGGKLIEPLIRLNQLTGRDLLTSMGSADEMMLGLADAFAAMTDETEKAELASKIFGGSGLAMVNVLNQGSVALRRQRMEARELGIVLSADAARQSEVFIDSLHRAKSVVNGIKNEIGIELMPVVIDYMKRFKEWVLLNKQWLKFTITKNLRAMIKGFKVLLGFVKIAFKVFSGLVTSLGGLERVLKIVTIALAAFTAVKFLSAIGNMAMAITHGLVAAFNLLGNTALIAQAKMLLMPIAVGAAVAAVLLIIEDLVAFFQGRDSLTSEMLDWIGPLNFDEVLKGMLISLEEIKEEIQKWVANLFDFDTIGALNEHMEGLQTKFAKSVAGFFGFGDDEDENEEQKKNIAGNLKDAGVATPQATAPRPDLRLIQGGAAGGQTNNNVTNNNNVTVSVEVPEGTTPDEGRRMVEQGIKDALQEMARETQAATGTNVER